VALGLLRALGLRSVATGVDNQPQLSWLRARGCEYGQGGCFGAPATSEKFLEALPDVELQGVSGSVG
jgi:EAL domain-containing protein (putative c-di-GMP-specific phosphodiesterase class I)